MRHMRRAAAMAALAANVPLGDLLGADVVAHGVAAVAERTRRSLHVVGRIQRGPPVRAVLDEVAPPDAMGDVPLRRLDEVVVADLGEIPLLPAASVDEGHALPRE